ncbi:FtsX-like permease family protein [Streptomyces narbonensis]
MLLVTGVSGALGSLVAARLAGRADVVLGTRAGLPGTRRVDFDAPETLPEAFAGVGTLLLVSAGYGEDDTVVARHEAAISAAERAGVRHLVYTSLSGDGDHLAYSLAHRWTERRLRRSTTLDWTILRNGLYAELLAGIAAPDAENRITGPLGEGRLAAVAREDLADVAVSVATDPAAHRGRVYELVGERPPSAAPSLAAALGADLRPAAAAAARAPSRGRCASGAVPLVQRADAGRRLAAPVLVTVALAGTLFGSAASVTRTRGVEAREQTAAQYVVSGEDLKEVGPSALPDGAVASPTASTSLFVRDGAEAVVKYGARAVADPAAFAELARLPVVAGDLRDLDDRSIVVNEEFERHRIGETVEIWRADGSGPVRLRVVAVLALGTGDNGPYVTRANAPGAPLDRIDASGGGAATVRALEASGGTVRTAGAWAAAGHPESGPQARLGMILVLGIALVYTVIGLANTLLMATSVRGGELASLRLAGATRAQILRVVTGEAVLATAIGALLGLAVTAAVLGTLGAGLAALSAPVALVLPWATVGAAAGVCAAVAVAASALPAWRLTR